MYLDATGEISTRTQEYSESSHSGNNVPISKKDWKIDSQDALKIFSQEEAINSCFSTSGATMILMLSDSATPAPSWELDVFDCPQEPNLQIYFIDAQTGETIDNP